jgi:hypothetical protein
MLSLALFLVSIAVGMIDPIVAGIGIIAAAVFLKVGRAAGWITMGAGALALVILQIVISSAFQDRALADGVLHALSALVWFGLVIVVTRIIRPKTPSVGP